MNNRFFPLAANFVMVQRCGSITAAAAEMRLSKSLVSQRLSEFEEMLGLKLLTRTTRRISLTTAGERVLASCSPLVDQAATAETELGLGLTPDQPAEGQVRISGANSYLTRIITPLLPKLLQQHPGIRPVLVGSDQPVDLAAEDIDIGIRIGPVAPQPGARIALEPLERYICAAPGLIPNPGDIRCPADLAGLPTVLRRQEKPAWHLQRNQERITHIVADPCLSVSTIELAHAAVREGLGICLMADVIVEEDLRSGRLIRLLPGWQVTPIPVTMICRSGGRPGAVAAARSFLTAELAKKTAGEAANTASPAG